MTRCGLDCFFWCLEVLEFSWWFLSYDVTSYRKVSRRDDPFCMGLSSTSNMSRTTPRPFYLSERVQRTTSLIRYRQGTEPVSGRL
jgi:hypothetical protein